MVKLKRLFVAALILVLAAAGAVNSKNANEYAGTKSANFILIPVSAKGISLGEAYISVVDNAEGVYWNPAALTNVKYIDFSWMHNEYLLEIREELRAEHQGKFITDNLEQLERIRDLEHRLMEMLLAGKQPE